MPKKITRSKRKELRAKGQLQPLPRQTEARKVAEREAEDEAARARIHEAREEIARAHDADDDDAPPASGKQKRGSGRRDEPTKAKPKRDFTLLIVAGLVAAAGVLYWALQRPTASTKPTTAATAAPVHTGPTMVLPPNHPPMPTQPPATQPAAQATTAAPPPEVPAPAPPPVVVAPTAAPVAVAPAPTAKPTATPAPKPPAATAAPAAPPPPAAKPPPKKSDSDPYG